MPAGFNRLLTDIKRAPASASPGRDDGLGDSALSRRDLIVPALFEHNASRALCGVCRSLAFCFGNFGSGLSLRLQNIFIMKLLFLFVVTLFLLAGKSFRFFFFRNFTAVSVIAHILISAPRSASRQELRKQMCRKLLFVLHKTDLNVKIGIFFIIPLADGS